MRFFRLLFGVAILGLFIFVHTIVKANDTLIREDEVIANESELVFICGNQSVANEYNVSGRYVTWSNDSPPHGNRYTVTIAVPSTGWPGQSCPNEEFIPLYTNPYFDAQFGQKVRLWAPDTTPPTISNLTAGSITQTGATITWTTNESATHTIKYGTTSGSYDSYPNTKAAGSGTSASGAL